MCTGGVLYKQRSEIIKYHLSQCEKHLHSHYNKNILNIILAPGFHISTLNDEDRGRMCNIRKLYEKVNYTLFMVQSQLCLTLINQWQ